MTTLLLINHWNTTSTEITTVNYSKTTKKQLQNKYKMTGDWNSRMKICWNDEMHNEKVQKIIQFKPLLSNYMSFDLEPNNRF